MDRDFWLARWRENRIGFHQETINPHLQAHLSALELKRDDQVFVPLCGKSLDMLWLRGQGYRVLGVEISALAVRAFFDENRLTATVETRADFSVYRAEGIEIYCGDVFHLTRADTARVAGVYDRAAIIAFPDELRRPYARHLSALLAPHTPALMVTLEYDQREMQGPPFSVEEGEVRALFGEAFDIQILGSKDKLDVTGPSRYKEQGLSRLTERVYLLKKCGAA